MPEAKDLRDLVIEEVDDARDIYDFARQLEPLMPIESFDALVEATRERRLRFRDTEFDVESLHGMLPSIVFPVRDIGGLVARVGEIVRRVPPALGVDLDSESGAARVRRARGELTPGLPYASRNAVAAAPAIFRERPPADTTTPTDHDK